MNLNPQEANNNIVSSYTSQTTGTRQSPIVKVNANKEANSAVFTKVRVSFY
ncbi:MAG: hypothetical protein WCZ90_01430 [Melioribacteraceae bacterium]